MDKFKFYNIILILSWAIIIQGCSNNNSEKPPNLNSETESNNTESKHEHSNNTDEKNKTLLIGVWQLDSTIQTASGLAASSGGGTLKQSDLGQYSKLIDNDCVVTFYQKKYSKVGEKIQVEEFNDNKGHIITTIDQFTIKYSNKKHIASSNYQVKNNNILDSFKWGKEQENETKSVYKILKLDSTNLIYEFDNGLQPVSYYFSRATNPLDLLEEILDLKCQFGKSLVNCCGSRRNYDKNVDIAIDNYSNVKSELNIKIKNEIEEMLDVLDNSRNKIADDSPEGCFRADLFLSLIKNKAVKIRNGLCK